MVADVPDVMNANDHIAAVKTALSGIEDFPIWSQETTGRLPALFAVPHVSRRFTGESTRHSGHLGIQGWRLVLRVSARAPGECRWGLWQATKALEEHSLTVAGQQTSPLELESDDLPREDDDNRYSAAVTWIYTL